MRLIIFAIAIAFTSCATEQPPTLQAPPEPEAAMEYRSYPLAMNGWRVFPNGKRGEGQVCTSGSNFLRVGGTTLNGQWVKDRFVTDSAEYSIAWGQLPSGLGGGCIIYVFKSGKPFFEVEASCPN